MRGKRAPRSFQVSETQYRMVSGGACGCARSKRSGRRPVPLAARSGCQDFGAGGGAAPAGDCAVACSSATAAVMWSRPRSACRYLMGHFNAGWPWECDYLIRRHILVPLIKLWSTTTGGCSLDYFWRLFDSSKQLPYYIYQCGS